MEFKEKYLKYKNKYLELKKQLGGLKTRPGLTIADIPAIGLFYNLTNNPIANAGGHISDAQLQLTNDAIAANTPLPTHFYTDLLETIFRCGFDNTANRTAVSNQFIINGLNIINKIYIYDVANMGGKIQTYRNTQHNRLPPLEETDPILNTISHNMEAIEDSLFDERLNQHQITQLEAQLEIQIQAYETRLLQLGIARDQFVNLAHGNVTNTIGVDQTKFTVDASGNILKLDGSLAFPVENVATDARGNIIDPVTNGVIIHNSEIRLFEETPVPSLTSNTATQFHKDFMKNIIMHADNARKNNYERNLYILCGKNLRNTIRGLTEDNLLAAFTELGLARADFPNIMTLTSNLHKPSAGAPRGIPYLVENSADDDLLFWICGMLFSQFLTKSAEHIKSGDPVTGLRIENTNINSVPPTIRVIPANISGPHKSTFYLNDGPSLFLITNDTQKMYDAKPGGAKNLWSEFLDINRVGNIVGNLTITRVFLNGVDNNYIRNCCENVLTFIMHHNNIPGNYYENFNPQKYQRDKMGFKITQKCSNDQLYTPANIINNTIDNINDLVTQINSYNPANNNQPTFGTGRDCGNYEKFMTLIMFLKHTYYATPWVNENQPFHSMSEGTIDNLVPRRLA